MEMEIEMETEMEMETDMETLAWYWTGLTQTPSFSAGQKLNVLIQPVTCS